MDVPAIPGTPESCLLEVADERFMSSEDDIESERAALESFMPRKRLRAAEAAVILRE
jgi:hypothetical protein